MKGITLSILLTVYLLLGIVSASSISSLTVVSNTVYQNTNTTNPLYISIQAQGTSYGFVGPTSSNTQYQVYSLSESITGVLGAVLNYNLSATEVVPPLWYYRLQYTGNAIFQGTYSGNTVTTLNGLTGAVSLVAGSNITITPGSNTITITEGNTVGGYDDIAVIALLAIGGCLYFMLQNEAMNEKKELKTLAVLVLFIFMLVAAYIVLSNV